MQNTENFNLKVYDGEDLFNPLTVENVNMNAIDTQMKKNENHAVGDATELVSGTVHAITRLTPDAPMLRFTATSRFTVGDTFTVDGVQVSALTVSGEQLPDGAYIIGSEVLAYLKGTLLTVFTSQGTLATAKNALKLGGNDPEYYATASEVQIAQETATAAGNLANEVNNSLKLKTISVNNVNYANGASYYKYDGIGNKKVKVEALINQTLPANAEYPINNIPSSLKPNNDIQFIVITTLGNPCTVVLKQNGVLYLKPNVNLTTNEGIFSNFLEFAI